MSNLQKAVERVKKTLGRKKEIDLYANKKELQQDKEYEEYLDAIDKDFDPEEEEATTSEESSEEEEMKDFIVKDSEPISQEQSEDEDTQETDSSDEEPSTPPLSIAKSRPRRIVPVKKVEIYYDVLPRKPKVPVKEIETKTETLSKPAEEVPKPVV